MNSRLKRAIAYLVIAAQLLLSAPLAMGSSSSPAGRDGATPCAGAMAATSHASHCPCCPDGMGAGVDCLATCLATSAPPASLTLFVPATAPAAVSFAPIPARFLADDPPVKPPPIR